MEDSTIDEFIEAHIEGKFQFLEENLFPKQKEHDNMLKEFEKVTKMLLRAQKTNNYGPISKFVSTSSFKGVLGSNDENGCPDVGMDDMVFKTSAVRVKREKLSTSSNASIQSVKDDAENMPAPKMPPPKTKRVKKEKVSNVVKVKQEPSSEGSKRVTRSRAERSSDVILQNPVVPVVDLSNSLENEEEAPVRSTRTETKKKGDAPVRSTRTRKKKDEDAKEEAEVPTETKTRTKRDRSESGIEKNPSEQKRSKSDSPPGDEATNNISAQTEYEDAVSHLETRQPNATFIYPNENIEGKDKHSSGIMSETIVIKSNNSNDMITDDESIEEPVAANSKSKAKNTNTKQVFSPYENSPVKKKVEAFEKLQKNENTPVSKINTSKILKEIEGNKGFVTEKAKGFVGTIHKTNPPSASKIGRFIGQKTSVMNNSMSTSKMSTTPNCKSGNDFKERELRRQEKEKEQKKKEMLKQALTDERRKRYEEKVLRVQQQQKEAQEKEKERALEQQRIKEERYKMVVQQKEEKQRLLKEENERKRLLAKQRAEEKRKEEEANRLAAQGKIDQKRRVDTDVPTKSSDATPIYLLQPTPALPCNDCYDSDDERFTEKRPGPIWATRPYVKKQDYIQIAAGHKIKNTLFCCQSQNIDLRDVFQRIDPKKLKRTSSANWEKPPRFTLLPSTMDSD